MKEAKPHPPPVRARTPTLVPDAAASVLIIPFSALAPSCSIASTRTSA